jgi:hypothetical protein
MFRKTQVIRATPAAKTSGAEASGRATTTPNSANEQLPAETLAAIRREAREFFAARARAIQTDKRFVGKVNMAILLSVNAPDMSIDMIADYVAKCAPESAAPRPPYVAEPLMRVVRTVRDGSEW